MRKVWVARFGIFAVALTALTLRVRSVPARTTDATWQLALERGVGCVRALAERGPGSLVDAACTGLGARPLAPLLGAWGRLSVGRVGLLDMASSERWPWLVLGALAPLFVFELVRRAHADRAGLFAAAWLIALPGFTLDVARADPDTLLGVSWLPALAAYAAWLAARSARGQTRSLGLVALASTGSVAFVLGAAWVVPLIAVHFVFRKPALGWRLLGRGRLPLPSAVLVGAFCCGLAALELDPSLWHSDPPKVIVTWFGAASVEPPPGSPHFALWIWMLAGVGLLALAWRALGRRFATGEQRPARDAAATGALITLGLALGLVLGGALSALPFLAIASALGASALSRVLVRERWRLPLELAWLVLAAVS